MSMYAIDLKKYNIPKHQILGVYDESDKSLKYTNAI